MQDSPAHGGAETREDLPLKAGAGGGAGGGAGVARWCGGPRLVVACFAALSAAITVALAAQLYYGDYEVVPHGSVSSSAAACSAAGTDALKAGGRALDAAAAAALCLAVLAPHATSLDASGAMIYWEYRQVRTQKPTAAEWGGAGSGGAAGRPPRPPRPPRLVAALAALHAQYGALPWARVLQPAVRLARDGFPASAALAAARAARGDAALAPGDLVTAPALAAYLQTLQRNTSAALAAQWGGGGVRLGAAAVGDAGGARVAAAGGGAAAALAALAALGVAPPDADEAQRRVVEALQRTKAGEPAGADSGVATGLAVVDRFDTYVALVTGLSVPFGSEVAEEGAAGGVAGGAAGWVRDEPTRELELAPAVMYEPRVCGTRFVLGGESAAALAQAAAALAAGGGASAVERARLAVRAGGALQQEALRPPPPAAALPASLGTALGTTLGTTLGTAAAPYAAVNVVQQSADALLSHADSRGGGLASRF